MGPLFLSVFFIIFFLFIPFLAPRNSVYAAVLINEVCPKECGVEKTQWVELYNNGGDLVSLAEWKLENVGGDKKIYTFPSDATISPHDFITFDQMQTSINLYSEGDTVKLINAGNAVVDSQSYPSILGYNTSMGRSVDGGGTWSMCASWTKRLTNNCPAPTPSPTTLPSHTPTSTRVPVSTPLPTTVPALASPTPVFSTANQPAQSQVLGLATISTTDAPTSNTEKRLGIASLTVAAFALFGLVIRWYSRRK